MDIIIVTISPDLRLQYNNKITSYKLIDLLVGYEPAGLTVHPLQNDRGWVNFFRMGV